MKYSIIVPVYNVEKYILKCLESIDNQSYSNYEVIIVNDESPDSSEKIIKKFIKGKEKFHYYKKENGGLSDARNYGLQYVTGDYILFIDSDDFIEKDLLKRINVKAKENTCDVIRYGLNIVNEKGKIIKENTNILEYNYALDDAIKAIILNEYTEPAWLYAYNSNFWKKYNFKYAKGKIHEDFGLTPIILSKAETVCIIDYRGYNYVQRENSIMSDINYEKIKKRTKDFQDFYLKHKEEIKPTNKVNKMILGFSAEATLYKTRELKNQELEEAIKFIKKQKLIKQIYNFNFKKIIQKIYLSIFLKKHLKKLSKEFYNES